MQSNHRSIFFFPSVMPNLIDIDVPTKPTFIISSKSSVESSVGSDRAVLFHFANCDKFLTNSSSATKDHKSKKQRTRHTHFLSFFFKDPDSNKEPSFADKSYQASLSFHTAFRGFLFLHDTDARADAVLLFILEPVATAFFALRFLFLRKDTSRSSCSSSSEFLATTLNNNQPAPPAVHATQSAFVGTTDHNPTLTCCLLGCGDRA